MRGLYLFFSGVERFFEKEVTDAVGDYVIEHLLFWFVALLGIIPIVWWIIEEWKELGWL